MAGSPGGQIGGGRTTRERPVNRSGRRPLARHHESVGCRPAGSRRRRVEPREASASRPVVMIDGREGVLIPGGLQRWQSTQAVKRPGEDKRTSSRSRRPSASRPRSCSTPARGDAARPDAPLGRARHGRGGHGPVPGHEAGHRPGHRGRLLLRLRPAAAADDGRPGGDRGAHGRVRRGRPSVRQRKVLDAGRRPRVLRRADQPYKVEILDDLAANGRGQAASRQPEVSTFYQHGPFIDLCRGPHVESTGKIGPFKLLAVSGAYWRGDQKRPTLQRIYGTVWSTQEELDHFLWRREEAKKRDHRRLGVQLDLFSFHDVSPGAAFWHPKGWTLYNTLRDAMRDIQKRRGYQEIYTPPLVHKKLWQQSGHWDLYRDNMFLVEAEDADVQPQADELSGVDVHLPLARALVPRVPAAPVRVRRAAPLRAVRRPFGPDARAPLLHGRRPHLRHAGADPGRDPGADGRGDGVLRLVRPRADADVRHEAGEGAGRRGRRGARRRR